MDKILGGIRDALIVVAIVLFIGFLFVAQFQMWNAFFDKF